MTLRHQENLCFISICLFINKKITKKSPVHNSCIKNAKNLTKSMAQLLIFFFAIDSKKFRVVYFVGKNDVL